MHQSNYGTNQILRSFEEWKEDEILVNFTKKKLRKVFDSIYSRKKKSNQLMQGIMLTKNTVLHVDDIRTIR